MFAIEYQDSTLKADLIPGRLVDFAKRPASSWFIVRRSNAGEKTVYEILAGGYARSPGNGIFENADVDPRDGVYLILVPGGRNSGLLKSYPAGTKLETHTRMKDGLSVFAIHVPKQGH